MKRNFTFFFLLLCGYLGFAAAPTVPSSSLTFNSLDGAQFSALFTIGNGTSRIVVMREGAPVAGKPVDGIDYTANNTFGTAGTEFTAAGEYVIAKGSLYAFTVTKLQPGKTYYIAVFEYNGTGAAIQYLMLPLTGSQSTVVAPVTQTSGLTGAGIAGNTFTLNWTKGSGTGRIILARKGAPVNAVPADLTGYSGDQYFGNGTKLGTDNYVVYKGSAATTAIKNLEPNTTYYFAAFEYNGSNSPVYLSPGATYSLTTNVGPTTGPTSATFTNVEGNRMTISLTPGNGNRRLFIIKKASAVTAVPVNGISYTANAAYGTAGTEIATGEFVVAATTGNLVTVTNLEPNTVYHFRVYDYDVDNVGNTYYLTSSYAVKNGSTAITPATVATNLNMVTLTGSSATISFTNGSGSYRMVTMKAGSMVDAVPVNLTKYTANNSFGSGMEVAPANYCIAWGINGSQFTVNNLQPGVTYYVAVHEFNGNEYPVYSATAATYSFTVPLEPTVISKTPLLSSVDGKSFRLTWTNGNGARRIVIAKKGSAVTAKPADNIAYAANENFGQGDVLNSDEYVVYNGIANVFDLKNLEASTAYYFAVFEYNVSADGKPDYLISSWLTTNGSTAAWPTAPAAINSVSALTASQVTINFTKGNGASRIFIMKQGAPVSALPQDFTKYSYSGNFGNAGSLISDGNYVVYNTSSTGSFNVNSLQPGTTYYVSVFEYNGANEPVYLRTTPGIYNFTTTDVPGATVPTTPASNAVTENIDGNKFTLRWTSGNGEKRIVVMKQGGAVTFLPLASTAYTANAAMGNGTDLGDGQYVVYNGNNSTVDITNLQPEATYYFTVFEYNGSGTLIRYLTAPVLTGSVSTVKAPLTPASAVTTTIGEKDLTLSWTNGSGAARIVIIKEASAVTGKPVNLSVYPANTVFKSGAQVTAGEYVVYAGTASTVKVTGLTANTTYYYNIVEYNGTAAPVYNTTSVASGSAATSSTLPVKLLYFKVKATGEGVTLNWATAQEVNSASFTIERSYDGKRFDAIASIAAAGNANQLTEYSYKDLAAKGEKIYYRLQQTDMDGTTVTSAIQSVQLNNNSLQVNVFPNPVQNQFRITLPDGVTEGMVSLFDAKGTLVKQQRIIAGQPINCSGLNKGLYYLNIKAGDKLYHSTIVKQ
ncbi:MAG: T9SS type A sorting domain-containing protein [Chitinophagaceae bacterium]